MRCFLHRQYSEEDGECKIHNGQCQGWIQYSDRDYEPQWLSEQLQEAERKERQELRKKESSWRKALAFLFSKNPSDGAVAKK